MLLSIAVSHGSEPPGFRPRPASDYPSHQTIGKVKFAAVKYESDEETKPVFGKDNPNEYGVLPILLVIQNDGDDTLLLDRMQVSYQFGRNVLDPVPARELPTVVGPKRPKTGPGVAYPIPLPKKKAPLTSPEFDTRAWAAKSLLKQDSAHGFLYFLTRHQRNAILLVRGIRLASTGQEMFFAEIPIDSATQ